MSALLTSAEISSYRSHFRVVPILFRKSPMSMARIAKVGLRVTPRSGLEGVMYPSGSGSCTPQGRYDSTRRSCNARGWRDRRRSGDQLCEPAEVLRDVHVTLLVEREVFPTESPILSLRVAPSSPASAANRIRATESLFADAINDLCNKICQ